MKKLNVFDPQKKSETKVFFQAVLKGSLSLQVKLRVKMSCLYPVEACHFELLPAGRSYSSFCRERSAFRHIGLTL